MAGVLSGRAGSALAPGISGLDAELGPAQALQPRSRRASVQEAENRIAPPAFLEEWVQAGRIQGFRPAEGGLRQANGLRRWALLPSNPLAEPS